jgi:very-short-patch-repair endonuclease
VQFRRQVVIGRHITDFCASSIRLIVEVDGGYHAHVVRLDAKREAKLTRMGYHVVRVSHELVVNHTQAAVHIVRSAVEELLPGWSA